MKTRKINLIAFPVVVLAAMLYLLAPNAQAQILKPGELIYSRAANVGENCSSGAIWALGQDGSNYRFIAQGHHPRISPDGRYLMFKRFNSSSLCSPFSIAPQWWIRDLARRAIMTETVSGMRPYFDHQARHGSLSVPVGELSFNNSVPRVINHCPTRLFPSWDSIVVRLGRNCCLRLGSNFLSLLHLALVDVKISVNLLDVVVVVDGFVEF